MQVYIKDQTTVGELACVNGLNNPGDEALPVNAACLVASLTGAPLAFSNVQTVGAGGSYVTPLSLTESTTVSDPNYSEFSSLSAGNIMLPVFVEQKNFTSTDNCNGVDPLYVAVGVNASITYTYDSEHAGAGINAVDGTGAHRSGYCAPEEAHLTKTIRNRDGAPSCLLAEIRGSGFIFLTSL